jgi:hypothetical protein
MLFFPTDGQLSSEFAEANNLIRRTDPTTGKPTGGFFEENRRVRCQKFRGEKSDGYAVPLSYLAWTGGDITKLEEGEQIDTFHGKPICSKYENEATRAAKRGPTPPSAVKKPESTMFRRHFDTEQWRYNSNKVPENAVVILTEKLHGTSQRFGYVQVTRIVERNPILRWLGFKPKSVTTWEEVVGTRNVALINDKTDPFYKDDSGFRYNAVAKLHGRLRKGETLYFEVVGSTETGKPIMAPQKIKDPELTERFGADMTYSYGCEPGECRVYVYRITQADEHGTVTELPWYQVQRRCEELGVSTVPQLDVLVNVDLDETMSAVELAVPDFSQSTLDPRHIREGVCIRVEHRDLFAVYKHKSFMFGVLEGYLKDTNVVDTEEAA